MNSTKPILNTYLLSVGLIVSALALVTACGSTTAKSTTETSSITGIQTGSNGSVPGSGGNISNLPDADSYLLQLNGMGGTVPSQTFSIQTSRTLKVKVTPLSAPNMRKAGDTHFVFPYGCSRYRVSVNGHVKTTGILRVDGVSQTGMSTCSKSPTYAILDFTNDESGNGATLVTIDNAEYDNCRHTWPLDYGCQMSALFADHESAATVQIQSDDTWMDP